MGFTNRLKHAWNAFRSRDETHSYSALGPSYGYKADKWFFSKGNDRTIITAIYNRIAMDAAAVKIRHVVNDENGVFQHYVTDGLDYCLNTEANIDQTGRNFIQNVVQNMLDDGFAAVVPIDTTLDPAISGSFDIQTMRVGQILQWFPEHVKVYVYNKKSGKKEEIIVPKRTTAIIENPFYSVMNDNNSVLARLIKKMSLIDNVDEEASRNKLDLIIQLPYVLKSKARQEQAELRRKQIEDQLNNSRYGIAYTDGTEKITQLGHSIENNYQAQIEYLTKLLYGQLGISEEIMNGTANEEQTLNYWSRTIEPIVSAITNELRRKFITKTARTQGHDLFFSRDPFALMPVSQLASIADTFTRNEIMTSNELRAKIGMPPSDDPNADVLRNKNMPIQDQMDAGYDDSSGYEVPSDEQESEPEAAEDSYMNMPISSIT